MDSLEMMRIGLDYNMLSAELVVVCPPLTHRLPPHTVSGTKSMLMHGKVLSNHKVFRGAFTDTPSYCEPGGFGSGCSACPRCG